MSFQSLPLLAVAGAEAEWNRLAWLKLEVKTLTLVFLFPANDMSSDIDIPEDCVDTIV